MRKVPRKPPTRSTAVRHVVTALLLAGSLSTLTACAASTRPAHKPHAETIRVTVLDASSGKPITGTEVRIHSDNGVRCITAPCPTNSMEWKGRTDTKGVFKMPKKIVQQSTTITAAGHTAGKDLARDASKSKPDEWVISLTPDR